MELDETPGGIAKAVAAIGHIQAVPMLLEVVCDITGMRFAVVARVTGKTWTACAVLDRLHLGIEAGDPLAFRTNVAFESQASRSPLVIERASTDLRYGDQIGPKPYQIESYVSVPIFLSSGHYFGNLCAMDPEAAKVGDPSVVSTFIRFAAHIASHLEQQTAKEHKQAALLDEGAAGELREQFIAILGHDLRNPLQAIYASSDVLERKIADAALAGVAARIKANARRMFALIDDVLDFARGRLGGGIAVELTDVENINTGLTTVVQELQDAQPECQILSSISVDRPVRCDLGRLQQVASNLLANALTHGRPHTPVKFTVRADESHLILGVWNAGEPIPPESIGKIFQPFWRHSVSASRNGLGLGLHICSQIVRAHGGQIFVTSTAAHGTLFTARLPLGISQTMAQADQPEALSAAL